MRLFFALAFLASTSIAHATDWNFPLDAVDFGCADDVGDVENEDRTEKDRCRG
jgi:hypothetical protein